MPTDKKSGDETGKFLRGTKLRWQEDVPKHSSWGVMYHPGQRTILAECRCIYTMGTMDLRVINSAGNEQIEKGQLITRPLNMILQLAEEVK